MALIRRIKLKKAFTLAEVLITLGIIGVVAAMTLPTVVTNYKKAKTLSVLKKAYSEVQNLFLDFKNEYNCNEYLNNCFPGDGEFRDKFALYLRDKRKFRDKFSEQTQIEYKYYKVEKSDNGKWLASYYPADQEGANKNKLLIAPSGLYVIGLELNQQDNYYNLYNGKFATPPNYFRAKVLIYTEPNMVRNTRDKDLKIIPTHGKEIFQFFIMADGQIIPNGSSKCGASSWNYSCGYYERTQSCNEGSTNQNNGVGCLARIISDGWQIKYPW